MRHTLSFLFVAAALAVVSCGPVKYTATNVNLLAVDEYAFIEPVADILYYNERNQPVYDADLSDRSGELIASIVDSQRYPFSKSIPMKYYSSDREVRKWIQSIGSISTSRLDRIRIPNDLQRAIKNSGHRYGVVIFLNGFIRSREAIRYEETTHAIGEALGMAIEMMTEKQKGKDEKKQTRRYKSVYETNPQQVEPYDSHFYCVVIDSEEDEVIHYIHPLPFLNHNPLDGRDVEEMLDRLLQDFRR